LGCGLSIARYQRVAPVTVADASGIHFDGLDDKMASRFHLGQLRWIDGPNAGLAAEIVGQSGQALVIEGPLLDEPKPGERAYLTEGCDKSLATCANRFANAINFRGEPHLPGNDLLTRFAAI
jgi:uncharacterized phage protein (TIGR02218 family)